MLSVRTHCTCSVFTCTCERVHLLASLCSLAIYVALIDWLFVCCWSGFRRLLGLVLLGADDRGRADLAAHWWIHRHHPQEGASTSCVATHYIQNFFLLNYSKCGRAYCLLKFEFVKSTVYTGDDMNFHCTCTCCVMLRSGTITVVCDVVFAEEGSGSPGHRRQRRVVHVRG